jgi:hypothetical protein
MAAKRGAPRDAVIALPAPDSTSPLTFLESL